MDEPVFPTAAAIAQVIVAAARETGESPERCAAKAYRVRCRHYAMHALIVCYPNIQRYVMARVCGAPADPRHFVRNSSKTTYSHKIKASWWNDASFGRVLEVAQRSMPPRPAAKLRAAAAAPPLRAAAAKPPCAPGPRPAVVAPAPERRAMTHRGQPESDYRPVSMAPSQPAGKRALQEMLAEAVRNTAKMPIGDR